MSNHNRHMRRTQVECPREGWRGAQSGAHDACGSVGPMAGSSRPPGSALPRLSRAMGLTIFLTLSRRICAAKLRFGVHAATSRNKVGGVKHCN